MYINTVYIDVTTRCNLYCKHCFNSDKQFEDMSFNKFKNIVDEIIKLKPFGVVISGGEPLLNSEINRMIKYCRDLNLLVGISTNATLIDYRGARFLSNNCSNIQVSLDGVDEFTHDYLRGKKGSFSKTINGIKNLVKSNANVTISTVVYKKNANQIIDLYKLCEKIKVNALKVQFIKNIGRAERNKHFINLNIIDERVDYIRMLKSNIEGKVELIIDDPTNELYVCTALDKAIYVDCFGNVYPCPFLTNSKFVLGKVGNNEDIFKIYESKLYYKFMKCKLDSYKKNTKCIAEVLNE